MVSTLWMPSPLSPKRKTVSVGPEPTVDGSVWSESTVDGPDVMPTPALVAREHWIMSSRSSSGLLPGKGLLPLLSYQAQR